MTKNSSPEASHEFWRVRTLKKELRKMTQNWGITEHFLWSAENGYQRAWFKPICIFSATHFTCILWANEVPGSFEIFRFRTLSWPVWTFLYRILSTPSFCSHEKLTHLALAVLFAKMVIFPVISSCYFLEYILFFISKVAQNVGIAVDWLRIIFGIWNTVVFIR